MSDDEVLDHEYDEDEDDEMNMNMNTDSNDDIDNDNDNSRRSRRNDNSNNNNNNNNHLGIRRNNTNGNLMHDMDPFATDESEMDNDINSNRFSDDGMSNYDPINNLNKQIVSEYDQLAFDIANSSNMRSQKSFSQSNNSINTMSHHTNTSKKSYGAKSTKSQKNNRNSNKSKKISNNNRNSNSSRHNKVKRLNPISSNAPYLSGSENDGMTSNNDSDNSDNTEHSKTKSKHTRVVTPVPHSKLSKKKNAGNKTSNNMNMNRGIIAHYNSQKSPKSNTTSPRQKPTLQYNPMPLGFKAQSINNMEKQLSLNDLAKEADHNHNHNMNKNNNNNNRKPNMHKNNTTITSTITSLTTATTRKRSDAPSMSEILSENNHHHHHGHHNKNVSTPQSVASTLFPPTTNRNGSMTHTFNNSHTSQQLGLMNKPISPSGSITENMTEMSIDNADAYEYEMLEHGHGLKRISQSYNIPPINKLSIQQKSTTMDSNNDTMLIHDGNGGAASREISRVDVIPEEADEDEYGSSIHSHKNTHPHKPSDDSINYININHSNKNINNIKNKNGEQSISMSMNHNNNNNNMNNMNNINHIQNKFHNKKIQIFHKSNVSLSTTMDKMRSMDSLETSGIDPFEKGVILKKPSVDTSTSIGHLSSSVIIPMISPPAATSPPPVISANNSPNQRGIINGARPRRVSSLGLPPHPDEQNHIKLMNSSSSSKIIGKYRVNNHHHHNKMDDNDEETPRTSLILAIDSPHYRETSLVVNYDEGSVLKDDGIYTPKSKSLISKRNRSNNSSGYYGHIPNQVHQYGFSPKHNNHHLINRRKGGNTRDTPTSLREIQTEELELVEQNDDIDDENSINNNKRKNKNNELSSPRDRMASKSKSKSSPKSSNGYRSSHYKNNNNNDSHHLKKINGKKKMSYSPRTSKYTQYAVRSDGDGSPIRGNLRSVDVDDDDETDIDDDRRRDNNNYNKKLNLHSTVNSDNIMDNNNSSREMMLSQQHRRKHSDFDNIRGGINGDNKWTKWIILAALSICFILGVFMGFGVSWIFFVND